LSSGIPPKGLAYQGFRYIQNAVSWDTVSVLTITAGIILGLLYGESALACGAALSMLYVMRVGGDYMTGRFLTPAFVLCYAIVLRHIPNRLKPALAISGMALVFGLLVPNPP